MTRDRRWYGDWGPLLVGMFIGLCIVTPAFAAMPPDLPIRFDDDARLYTLIGSGVLLFIAVVMRVMRRPSAADEAVQESSGYGMRFFPSDRPITLE